MRQVARDWMDVERKVQRGADDFEGAERVRLEHELASQRKTVDAATVLLERRSQIESEAARLRKCWLGRHIA